jgi:transcriptional regulator with GAF, ATPase, and Fis domain
MQRDADILLDLWREACQHIEIGECVERVAPLLARHMPVDLVIVRRFDLQRHSIETVALAGALDGSAPPAQRSEISPQDLEAVVAWSRRATVTRADPRAVREIPSGVIPHGIHGDVIAGPLRESDPIGVLLLIARPPHRFTDDDVDLASALVDPLSAALANDQRIHEMAVLREAAEADRQALLTRLGRREISDTIVGAETGLRTALDRVERVAQLDVPVLLLGETGSGKEVVARAIHTRSRRAAGPFLRVNCGAIPAGLIDSELFGHERGSFTGAVGERKGWFERADKGTLFLDEVGELPLEAQVRLLRVLQDGTLERVGGHRTLSVDVRIIAATHRNLQAMIATGRFREDLWYRIAVFPIALPPLRDRVEDIPDLARHFSLRAATRFGRPAVTPTPEDLDLLVRYPWPGNVRELGAVIERAVILGDGRRLEVARALGPLPGSPPEPTPSPEPIAIPIERFPTLDEMCARHIALALERTRGRIEGPNGAASLLGLNPHTLRGRMRKLGIDWQRFRNERPVQRGSGMRVGLSSGNESSVG